LDTQHDVRAHYEEGVAKLAEAALAKMSGGTSEEEVARWLVDVRNALKLESRTRTSPDALQAIEARTVAVYGNTLGPTVEQLRTAGKTWAQIIKSGSRAGAHPDGF
jgi:hypothetical protein